MGSTQTVAEPRPLRIAADDVAIDVRDVSVSFGASLVLDHISFACAPGQWTLLTGPSGVGKSTLLRVINGLCRPTTGRVHALGTWVPGRSARNARAVWRQTGTVLQEVALFETRSVRANVELSLRAAGAQRAAARGTAVEWLERLGLRDKCARYPWELSGGQQQRVALARALAPRPLLLLLDEPTSALDRDTARIVLDAIAELVRDGTTVVMSSHRADEVQAFCDQRIALRGDAAIEEGAAPAAHAEIA